jgi:signal transduction histidine kinase
MESPIRVLLIEDNAADARLIELMLGQSRGLQFKLSWASSLGDGIAHLAQHVVDVVLLDLGLPESTGLDTLKHLMARGVRVPTLVVFSGLTDEEIAVQALQQGAQDYLVKGQVDSALLVRAIRYAIGRSRAEEALRQAHAEAQLAKERAEEASRAKSNFLANMSHDLRTPLNGILGFAQILQWDRSLGERQQAGVSAIRQSGEHLLTLINDILDVAKIEAGKLEIFPGDFHLGQFLQVIEDIIRVKAQQKPELEFVCDYAESLPEAVRADERRLRQVLLNLLDNAVKFTDRGMVTLAVVHAPPSTLRFEVRDTGHALSEQQQARLFRPFEQVGDMHQRSGGTGLGLVICRQFVRLMGGDVKVDCRPGTGNIFWFELELPQVEWTGGPASAPSPLDALSSRAHRQSVLVVDDVPENRALLVVALEHAGFEVHQAGTGVTGIASAQALRPDIILMDIVMPDLDGVQAIQRLRCMPGFALTPIVAVSASATPEVEARTLAAGANAFVAKPVNLKALMQVVTSQLRVADRAALLTPAGRA